MQKRQNNQVKIIQSQEKEYQDSSLNQQLDDTYQSNNLCIGLGRCLIKKQNSSNYYRYQKCLYNCQLVKCINYDVCQQVHTEWEKSYSLGLCSRCLSNVGCKFVKADVSNCEICFETLQLFKIKCGHEFCSQCLKMIFGLLENQSIITKRENTQAELEEFIQQTNTINKFSTQSSCRCPLCRIDYKTRAERIQLKFGYMIDQ